MRNKLFPPLVFLLLIIFSTSCIKLNQCSRSWKFELPFNIENHENTYEVGDTIWVVSEFSSSLLDINSGDIINVGNFDFNINVSIDEIYGSPISFASDQFEVVKKQGNLNYVSLPNSPTIGGNAGYYQLQHDFNSDQYFFKYGLIPKKEGVFILSLISVFQAEFDDVDFGSDCVEEMDKILFNMNNKTGNNYQLLGLSPDPRIVEIPINEYNDAGMVTFTVVP